MWCSPSSGRTCGSGTSGVCVGRWGGRNTDAGALGCLRLPGPTLSAHAACAPRHCSDTCSSHPSPKPISAEPEY